MNAKKGRNLSFFPIFISVIFILFCTVVCIKLTKVNNRFDNIQEKIGNDSIQENFENRFNELKQDIDSLEREIGAQRNETKELENTVANLKNSIPNSPSGSDDNRGDKDSESSDEGKSRKNNGGNIVSLILSIIAVVLSSITIVFILKLYSKIKALPSKKDEVCNDNTQKSSPSNDINIEEIKKEVMKEVDATIAAQNKRISVLEKKEMDLANVNNKGSDPIKKVYFAQPCQLSADKGYFKEYSEVKDDDTRFEAEISENIAKFKPLAGVRLGDWLSSDNTKFALVCKNGIPSSSNGVKKMEVVSMGKAEKNEKNEWIIKEKSEVKFLR